MPFSGKTLGAEFGAQIPSLLAAAALAFLLIACQTPPLRPLDLEQPGWRVQHGQAVWTPNADRPEIVGELLVAIHPDGQAMVQFSKTPFPLVEARLDTKRWRIHFAPEARVFSGKGKPSARFGWLQVAAMLAGTDLPPLWQAQNPSEKEWMLRNPKSGETIHIHFL